MTYMIHPGQSHTGRKGSKLSFLDVFRCSVHVLLYGLWKGFFPEYLAHRWPYLNIYLFNSLGNCGGI